MTNKIAIKELKDPVVFIACGFGSGLMPVAPGTAGTVVAIPLYLLLSMFEQWVFFAVTAFVTIAGAWACSSLS